MMILLRERSEKGVWTAERKVYAEAPSQAALSTRLLPTSMQTQCGCIGIDFTMVLLHQESLLLEFLPHGLLVPAV